MRVGAAPDVDPRGSPRRGTEKGVQIFDLGVKVLSLFFIDEVAKYRDYCHDEKGEYARIFEEEYQLELDAHLGQFDSPISALFAPHRSKAIIWLLLYDKKSLDLVDPNVGKRATETDDVDA